MKKHHRVIIVGPKCLKVDEKQTTDSDTKDEQVFV